MDLSTGTRRVSSRNLFAGRHCVKVGTQFTFARGWSAAKRSQPLNYAIFSSRFQPVFPEIFASSAGRDRIFQLTSMLRFPHSTAVFDLSRITMRSRGCLRSCPGRQFPHAGRGRFLLAAFALLAVFVSPFAAITLAAQQAQTRSKPHLVPPPPKASPWARKHWRNVRDELKELARADATTTSAPPLLQFQGNVTTFQPISSNTVQALLREGNCSLSLMTVLTGSGYTLLSTTPNYQDTLHKLAQLTTTPDKFTGGCADGWPGRMSHFATLVGQTRQGDYVGAISQLNGTETALTTYVYDGSTLSSTSNPTGENTQEFVVGDLNGDGINDIVAPVSGAAGATSGSVAVLLGCGWVIQARSELSGTVHSRGHRASGLQRRRKT
jgi:hypothetical protein